MLAYDDRIKENQAIIQTYEVQYLWIVSDNVLTLVNPFSKHFATSNVRYVIPILIYCYTMYAAY